MFKFFKSEKGKIPNPVGSSQEVLEEKIPKSKGKVITSSDIKLDMNNTTKDLFQFDSELEINKIENYLKENHQVFSKGDLAASLGFTSIPSNINKVKIEKDAEVLKKEIQAKTEELDYIRKYSMEFPRYKFIPTRVFEDICKKYNLKTIFSSRYIKEIPIKNLEEINEFIKLYGLIRTEAYYAYWTGPNGLCKQVGVSFGNTVYAVGLKSGKGVSQVMNYVSKEEYDECSKKDYQKITHILNYYTQGRLGGEGRRNEAEDTPGLVISAPLDHFDYDGLYNSDGSEVKKVLDPIVSRPVPGGFIVITAWDKEAEIPEIQNHNLN